jgi:hypothetical protein
MRIDKKYWGGGFDHRPVLFLPPAASSATTATSVSKAAYCPPRDKTASVEKWHNMFLLVFNLTNRVVI